MQGYISIFKFRAHLRNLFVAKIVTWALRWDLIFFIVLGLFFSLPYAFSQNAATEEAPIAGPYSEYGEFDSSEDEAQDEKFFQYGRFFGVGLGSGVTTPTGNAGKLYQGGFPMVDLRVLYWFDFLIALQVMVQNSKHNYDAPPDGLSDVNFFRFLGQVKYYIDTRDLAAPVTFIGPHFIFGAGLYQRTDNIGSGTGTTSGDNTQTLQAFGVNAGIGFELTLKPKKTYLDLEGMAHFVQFSDQFDPKFKNVGILDRTGTWFTFGAALVWTW